MKGRFSWALGAMALGWILLSCQAGPAVKPTPADVPAAERAGLRASPYGILPFPKADWWLSSTRDMAERVGVSRPAVIWIVGVIGDDGSCWLNFPAPEGEETPELMVFSPTDLNETYLKEFDAQGVDVWLQVEPGVADVPTLIDAMLTRYGSHPSVVGVGIDVEWYHTDEDNYGRPITDAEAEAWVKKVREYNPNYRLFLKHWETQRMPPTYRDGLVFIDDSQELASLDAMVEEFKVWGETFAPAPVGFQFGYEADRSWWQALDNPPQAISGALKAAIPNAHEFYWVDFTAYELWPAKD